MKVYFYFTEFKSIKSIKCYITKNFKSNSIFLVKNGFNVDKCVFCDRLAATTLNIKEENDRWYIEDFDYYKGNKVCRDKNCKCNKINHLSYEWLVNVRGMSEEEASNYLKNKAKRSSNTLRDKGWYDDISNNPFSKEYWMKKGYSEEEANEKINSRIYNRPEFWKKRGYNEDAAINLAKKSACRDLSFFITKYGDDIGRKKYESYVEKQRKKFTIEYIMNKNNCSIKEAKRIRKQYLEKMYRGNYKFSQASINFFNKILSKINFPIEILDKIYYGNNELGCYDYLYDKYYFYDFVIEPLKICIEFNGVTWHPKSPDQDWYQPNTHKNAKEVYEHDLRKKELLEQEGYKYFIVWDDDLYKDEENILNFINKKLTEYETY